MTRPVPIGVVTVSDRASAGVYQDLGGPAMVEWLGKALLTPWTPVARLIAVDQSRVYDPERAGEVQVTSPPRRPRRCATR